MAKRKKVESKAINAEVADKEVIGSMSLYNCNNLIAEIEAKAEMNDGEIPEEEMRMLVEAQTQQPVKLKNLCHYIRHLELGVDTCKAEEKRIAGLRKKAEKRIDSIKRGLVPFVGSKGKVDLDTFKLSTRKSTSVKLADGFDVEFYCDRKVSLVPNKKFIKESLENNEVIPGAELEHKESLQIK